MVIPISFAGPTFTVIPKGPFALRESALFGFGQRHDEAFDGTMRLAFCVDGLTAQAGVTVSQAADGTVKGTICGVTGAAQPESIARQVLRVLSLDHDADGFVALCERDPVLRRLIAAAPGLRPPLFYSPYEAALWSVLSTRVAPATAQRFRRRLSEHAGARFELEGKSLCSVPLPQHMLELGADGIRKVAGIEARRAERLWAIAQAMLGDPLDAETLERLDPDAARKRLRALPGIGPFYADLILVRATGSTDVLPLREPRLLALLSQLYGEADGEAVAKRMGSVWSPWRTWVAVLIRAAGPRILETSAALGPLPFSHRARIRQ